MFDEVWNQYGNDIADKFNTSDDSGSFFVKLIREYEDRFYADNSIEKQIALFRLELYQKVLTELKKLNPVKFESICKGTPYYLMGMFAFYLHNYGQALFYINEAIVEDRRFPPKNWWLDSSAAKFIFLDDNYPNPSDNIFKRFVGNMKKLVNEEIEHFTNRTGELFPFSDYENFVKQIIEIKGNNEHSIITSIYSFIAEKQDIITLLHTRSSEGIIIEPILLHLFKGTIIFESLLKKYYGTYTTGRKTYSLRYSPLENILTHIDVQSDLGFAFSSSHVKSLQNVVNSISGVNIDNAFEVTYKLRNLSAHNLCWNDGTLFNNPQNYIDLFNKVMDAIFYIISKKK